MLYCTGEKETGETEGKMKFENGQSGGMREKKIAAALQSVVFPHGYFILQHLKALKHE